MTMRQSRAASDAEPDMLPRLVLFTVLLVGLVVAWPAFLGGVILRILLGARASHRWWLLAIALLAVVACVWVALHRLDLTQQIVRLWHVVQIHAWTSLVPQLLPIWLASLALTPLITSVLLLLAQRSNTAQTLLATQAQQANDERRLSRSAARRVHHAPSSIYQRSREAVVGSVSLHDQTTTGQTPTQSVSQSRWTRSVKRCLHLLHMAQQAMHWRYDNAQQMQKVVLGCAIAGDLAAPGSPWRMRHGLDNGWLAIPDTELRLPGVLLGGSGTGKTETVLRMATETAGALGWQVIYLDAKGDVRTAARFVAAMRAAGRQRVEVFPATRYDGWRGDTTDILNRLLQTQDFTEEYYQAVAKQLLYLALTLPDRSGPPRSADDLLGRLDLATLRTLYEGRPEARKLAGIDPKQAHGVFARYDGFFSALGGQLDGDWAFEDVDAAYLLLDGLALKEEAASLGRFLLDDFGHYVSRRKDPNRQVLLIVDEFSALALKADAANLSERLRGHGASIFVTSQSYAGLGEQAERILGAANVVILHRIADPRDLVERAGMERGIEASHLVEGERLTGRATLRPRDRFKVDPDRVRTLEPGEAYVIAHGRAEWTRIAQVPVEQEAVAEIHATLAQMLTTALDRRRAQALTAPKTVDLPLIPEFPGLVGEGGALVAASSGERSGKPPRRKRTRTARSPRVKRGPSASADSLEAPPPASAAQARTDTTDSNTPDGFTASIPSEVPEDSEVPRGGGGGEADKKSPQ